MVCCLTAGFVKETLKPVGNSIRNPTFSESLSMRFAFNADTMALISLATSAKFVSSTPVAGIVLSTRALIALNSVPGETWSPSAFAEIEMVTDSLARLESPP